MPSYELNIEVFETDRPGAGGHLVDIINVFVSPVDGGSLADAIAEIQYRLSAYIR